MGSYIIIAFRKITSIEDVGGHVNGADARVDAHITEMLAVGHDKFLVVVEQFAGPRTRFMIHVQTLGIVVFDSLGTLSHLVQILS